MSHWYWSKFWSIWVNKWVRFPIPYSFMYSNFQAWILAKINKNLKMSTVAGQFAISHGSYDLNLGSEILILGRDIRSRIYQNPVHVSMAGSTLTFFILFSKKIKVRSLPYSKILRPKSTVPKDISGVYYPKWKYWYMRNCEVLHSYLYRSLA